MRAPQVSLGAGAVVTRTVLGLVLRRASGHRRLLAAVIIGVVLASTETLFNDGARQGFGFDGIDVTPAGEVYLALLAWNRAARLDKGELQMLARDFRGASDLVYDAARERLIVTNWNQFSLGFGTRPQLPFALDAVEFAETP